MDSQQVSCSSIVEQAIGSFVSFHQQLGCFNSDWHQHEWGQLIYAEKGCVHINSQGKQILIPSWYGIWIPANTDHEIWSTAPQLRIRSVCFPVSGQSPNLCRNVAVFPVSPLLREMIFYTERWSQDHSDNSQASTFLQVIQDILAGEIEKSISFHLPSTTHTKLLIITDYIRNHISKSITFPSIAKEFSYSVRTLNRLFIRELGVSFSTYRKIARVMKALELIEMGNDNVSQLATDVGYESVATFSNNFLEICGFRPLKFINSKRRR